jgi:hypothetical protein
VIEAAPIPEASVASVVEDLLTVGGWAWLHQRPARRAGEGWAAPVSGNASKGWPDYFACRGGEAVAIEAKGSRGRLSPEQGEWLDRLNAVPGIDAYIVGPSDLEWLERRLLDQPTQMSLTFNSTQATYRERKP